MLNSTRHLCDSLYKYLQRNNTLPFQISAGLIFFISIPAAIATTFANILVLYTLYVTPGLHTAGNVHITALAISDAFVGLVALPINAVLRALSVFSIQVCWLKKAYSLSIAAGTGISLLNATAISIDRCIAVLFTKAYRKWSLKTKYKVVVLGLWLTWIFFLGLAAAKIVPAENFHFILVAGTILSVLLVSVCYVLILIKIRKVTNIISDLDPSNISSAEKSKKEKKRLATIGMIMLFLLICYLPKSFCIILSVFHGNRADIVQQCGRWSELVLLLNSGINPFIYCKRIDNIRAEVVKNMKKLLRKKAQVGPED